MIKAVGTKDGKPLYIFGLSQGNWTRLRQGKPILIDLDVIAMHAESNGQRGAVLLLGGKSERDILDELNRVGMPEAENTYTYDDRNEL